MPTRLKIRLKFRLLHLRLSAFHLKIRLINWLGMQFFHLSQWCTHAMIGEKVLTAYREKSPDAAKLIQDRYNLLNSIDNDFCACDMLGTMHRQVTKTPKL